jgi:hypothetical protein
LGVVLEAKAPSATHRTTSGLGNTRDQLEREAYLAGAHLIFQGGHFRH